MSGNGIDIATLCKLDSVEFAKKAVGLCVEKVLEDARQAMEFDVWIGNKRTAVNENNGFIIDIKISIMLGL